MTIIPNLPDSLMDLHHHWHQAAAHPGAGGGRLHPMGTPGGGLEFLTFHKDFMAQVFAWMATQTFNPPLDIAAWTAIPAALKTVAGGWSIGLATQETRLVSGAPPFASADELGTFIEVGIHGWIHGAVANVYKEPVVGTLHSPQSTYFYQIHGLVNHWWAQWQHTHKRFIKDAVDNGNLKRIVDSKRQIKEVKEKDILDQKQVKEFKEKDKDLVEGGGFPDLGGDPIFPFAQPSVTPSLGELQVGQLTERVAQLERQLATGQPFIRREERPDVGGAATGGGERPDHGHGGR